VEENCLRRDKCVAAAAALLALLAVVRVVHTYPFTAQAFDEPCHVSSALELLDKGTYTLDPYNTPLARIAIGIPLYLAGERYPQLPPEDPDRQNYNYVGNKILYEDGHYLRNLELARSGVLPFLLVSVVMVFLWTRREYGDFAALIAVALFTTLPVVLAFSSIAYTDMAAACAQSAAWFAFATWLDKPSWKSSAWMGVTAGLALLAKFTTLIYLPTGALFMVFCKWWMGRKQLKAEPAIATRSLRQGAAALLIAFIVVWGGYRFSVSRLQEAMQLSPQAMPSFQHFPGPLRPLARKLVMSNPVIIAPGLFHGILAAYAFNKEGPPSYFLGKIKKGGWWYFFLVDLALKSPLPFLILSVVGLIALVRLARVRQWTWAAFAPGLAVLAVLLVTTSVKVYYGIRHVIVLFPLLSIIAGCGAMYLWQFQGRKRIWGRALLMGLLLWQGVSTVAASRDYIAYFNELAGHDPSRFFVAGCDLDCGQDLFRLSQALRARHIANITLAIWTSADMSKSDMPDFTVPPPFQPVKGWFAISLRSQRMGEFFHTTYPTGAFAWVDQYQPIEQIGKTIRLYYIPPNAGSGAKQSQGQVGSRTSPPAIVSGLKTQR
jgi:hypothetical protein